MPDLMTDRGGNLRAVSVPLGAGRQHHVDWIKSYAAGHMPPPIADVVAGIARPFVQSIIDTEVSRRAFGRICLMGDGAFAVHPHAAAGTAKACADAWTLGDALRATGGDLEAALERCEPGQQELGRQLLARTRDMGDRSQFAHRWVPGDPSLRFSLYGPGNSHAEVSESSR